MTTTHSMALIASGIKIVPTPAAFGPFKGIVALVSAAVAAAAALIATWLGNQRWHPEVYSIDRLAVLVVAIGLLLLSLATAAILIPVAVVGAVAASFCGYRYASALVGATHEISKPRPMKKARTEYVIGGDYTVQAKALEDKGWGVAAIHGQCGYKPENIWTRPSRVANKRRLARWYLPTVVGGTLALAAAGMAAGGLVGA